MACRTWPTRPSALKSTSAAARYSSAEPAPQLRCGAALIARYSEILGRPLGLPAPSVYREVSPGLVTAGFRDVVEGDNGAYAACPGWDGNTGLGSPDGGKLLEVLRANVDRYPYPTPAQADFFD